MAKFCPNCGKELQSAGICSDCGTINKPKRNNNTISNKTSVQVKTDKFSAFIFIICLIPFVSPIVALFRLRIITLIIIILQYIIFFLIPFLGRLVGGIAHIFIAISLAKSKSNIKVEFDSQTSGGGYDNGYEDEEEEFTDNKSKNLNNSGSKKKINNEIHEKVLNGFKKYIGVALYVLQTIIIIVSLVFSIVMLFKVISVNFSGFIFFLVIVILLLLVLIPSLIQLLSHFFIKTDYKRKLMKKFKNKKLISSFLEIDSKVLFIISTIIFLVIINIALLGVLISEGESIFNLFYVNLWLIYNYIFAVLYYKEIGKKGIVDELRKYSKYRIIKQIINILENN